MMNNESDYVIASKVMEKIGKSNSAWIDLFLVVGRVERMDEFEKLVFVALPVKVIKKMVRRWWWEYEKKCKKSHSVDSKVVGVDEAGGYNED